MKKIIFGYGFIIPLVLFIIHQLLQYGLCIPVPFLDAYLDPFCLSALLIPLYVLERKFLLGQYTITKTDIIVINLSFILISEILFPILSSRFVSDWLDAVAITLGSLWYYFTRNN